MNKLIASLLVLGVITTAGYGCDQVAIPKAQLELICEHEADKQTATLKAEDTKINEQFDMYINKKTLETYYVNKKTGKEDKEAWNATIKRGMKYDDLHWAYYNRCVKNGGKIE